MKISTAIVLIACCFSIQLKADLISNGSFDTCSFSSWQQQTDNLYVGTSPDFTIQNEEENCYAEISIDKENSNATQNNRLFQKVKNIAQLKTISFDYWLNIEPTLNDSVQPIAPDSFWIALTNDSSRYDQHGNIHSFLVNKTDIKTSTSIQSFSTQVTGTFDTSLDWSIEFFIEKGSIESSTIATTQSDSTWSSVAIDNVRLMSVDEPSNLTVIMLSLMFLFRFKGAMNWQIKS